MPDHRDDIPLEELQIYDGDELIFDGSDPSTYVVLHPDTAVCICGHTAAEHADPAIGDTRCLVIGERAQLEHVFDDGRDTVDAYCACLRFTPISALAGS